MSGRLVSTLADDVFKEGEHHFVFNIEKINTGIYFLKMQTGDFIKTKKLLVIK